VDENCTALRHLNRARNAWPRRPTSAEHPHAGGQGIARAGIAEATLGKGRTQPVCGRVDLGGKPHAASRGCRLGLEPLPLPEANIHRIRGEADPAVAAAEYEQILRETLRSERPRLDLVLLGIGDDGHTASLFPGTAAVREATRLVAAQYVDKLAAWRVSLAPPLLDAAAEVAFLVEGGGKAEVLAAILEGPYQPDVLPAQRIQPTAGRVRWLVDAAAAARLRRA